MEKKAIKNPRTLKLNLQGEKVSIKLKEYLQVTTIDDETIEGTFTKIRLPDNEDEETVIYINTKEYETSIGVDWIKMVYKAANE